MAVRFNSANGANVLDIIRDMSGLVAMSRICLARTLGDEREPIDS